MAPPAGGMGKGGHKIYIAQGGTARKASFLQGEHRGLVPFPEVFPAGFQELLPEGIVLRKMVDSPEGFCPAADQQFHIPGCGVLVLHGVFLSFDRGESAHGGLHGALYHYMTRGESPQVKESQNRREENGGEERWIAGTLL